MTLQDAIRLTLGYTRTMPDTMGPLDRARYYEAVSALAQPQIDTLPPGSEQDFWLNIQSSADTLSGLAAAEAGLKSSLPAPETLDASE